MATARSRAYPGIPLGEAVEKIHQLSKKLGSAPSYNRETFAAGMGYKGSNNGAFLRAVAALQQYGLIQKTATSYSLTPIAQKILFPTTSEDRMAAIRDAGLSPALFDQLYAKYQGQDLPDLLPNILVNDFGILPNVKDKATSLFRTSMEFAGLLDGNRLRSKGSGVEEGLNLGSINNSLGEESDKKHGNSLTEERENSALETSSVPLTTLTKNFGSERVARLSIPSDITDDERNKLVTLIQNM
ncbi:MAG TPA: hypothetical protein VIJ68_00745 [Candidatus Saccharimonadales bacterium]